MGFGIQGGSGENSGALVYAHKAVTTAGTAVALVASSTGVAPGNAVVIKALSTNTGLIYVGDSDVDSTNGFVLSANEAVAIYVTDLDIIYIDSSVNGEGVSYIVEG